MVFQPGNNANPRGRPKKNEEMRAELRRVLMLKDEQGFTNRRAVAEGLVKSARNGNVEATKLIFDRIDGKVKDEQSVEHSGEVTIHVVRDRVNPPPAHPAPLPTEDPG